jgi:hypothetical protein
MAVTFANLKAKFTFSAYQLITTIKITAFWDSAPRSLVKTDRRFGGTYCLHHKGVGERDNKTQYGRRQSSPNSPPTEPEISQF